MSIKNIFYDLDGTLLPMDFDAFVNAYFTQLASRLIASGFDKDRIIKDLESSVFQILSNDGSKTNERRFKDFFKSKYSDEEYNAIEEVIMDYYRNDFIETKKACGFNEKVPQCVKLAKELGIKQYITTNPFFPAIATLQRIEWAGLDVADFETVTTYENSCFCKPKLEYYEEVLNKFGLKPEECLMVGNNTDEDMIAEELGLSVFLVTDDLINKSNQDIARYPHGNFDDLMEYIRKM